MRPLVLAGILAALVGCSKNYEGTSFKAVVPHEHPAATEGHGEEGHEAHAEGEKQVGTASEMDRPDADAIPVEKSPMDRTGMAFPATAQPGE